MQYCEPRCPDSEHVDFFKISSVSHQRFGWFHVFLGNSKWLWKFHLRNLYREKNTIVQHIRRGTYLQIKVKYSIAVYLLFILILSWNIFWLFLCFLNRKLAPFSIFHVFGAQTQTHFYHLWWTRESLCELVKLDISISSYADNLVTIEDIQQVKYLNENCGKFFF